METFQREPLSRVMEEAEALSVRHWKEIGHFNKTALPLAPNWDAYAVIEVKGMLALYTARSDGRLIGYITFVVAPLMHYRDHRIAENTTVYILPEFRKGMLGYRFVKFAVNAVKELPGVAVVSLTEKVEHPFGPLARRLGFELKETKYYLEV